MEIEQNSDDESLDNCIKECNKELNEEYKSENRPETLPCFEKLPNLETRHENKETLLRGKAQANGVPRYSFRIAQTSKGNEQKIEEVSENSKCFFSLTIGKSIDGDGEIKVNWDKSSIRVQLIILELIKLLVVILFCKFFS